MAPTDATKSTTSPRAESPTTVKPFEMDDDDAPDNTTTPENDGTPAPSSTTAATTPAPPAPTVSDEPDEEAPPQPPRPLTEQQKKEHILKEAFPSIDVNVIKAVLAASGGHIDPAFNALLGMSDPDAVQNEPSQEEAPPPQPPRPSGRAQMSQMEADELYARQLAEQYNSGAYEARTSNRGHSGQRQATGLKPNEMYEREHSFIDDDLPIIRDNLRQGFLDTQKQVNTWFTSLKQKIDDAYNEDEDESQPSRHQNRQQFGRRSGESNRRSADYDRYDADPQVLGDDLAGMRLNQEGSRQSSSLNRPLPSPKADGRRVSFKDGAEDIDAYGASPKVPPKDNVPAGAGSKSSKWQPLSAVEPSPVTENDPFSLGDSDDERDRGGIKMEDNTESRLKQATADAMSDSLVDKKESGSDGK